MNKFRFGDLVVTSATLLTAYTIYHHRQYKEKLEEVHESNATLN